MTRRSMLLAMLLVGCIQEDLPTSELVVAEVDNLIDVDVSAGAIRWTTNSTEGSVIRAATLEERPVFSTSARVIGTTGANLLVDGETIYAADNFGVSALTNGASTRVIDEAFVNRIAIMKDGGLVWGHVGFVSWFGTSGVSHALTDASAIDDLVDAGDVIYASTFTSVPTTGRQYGSLYRIDRTTSTTTLIAHATAFQPEFDEYDGDDLSCGLYEIAGRIYWCVEGERGRTSGPRKLLAQVTPQGLEIVLPPQRASAPFVEHLGKFYWATDEDGVTPLWRAAPGGVPVRVLENGIGSIRAIDGGYAYGVAKSPSFPGVDVRRVPLP